jgi:hypothetical protein
MKNVFKMLAEKSKEYLEPVCSNNKKRLMKGAVKMCEDVNRILSHR